MSSSTSAESSAVADVAKIESMSAAERLEQRKKRFANVSILYYDDGNSHQEFLKN